MAKNRNKEWLKDSFEEATSGAGVADAKALAAAMRRFYERASEEAARRFAPPRRALPCSRFICEAADMIVRRARRHIGEDGSRLSWVAIGGFGRGLMSPGSTVRLLLLHDGEEPDAAMSASNQAATLLPDAVPHATVTLQTTPQAMALMQRNVLSASDLLETRLIDGSKKIYDEFRSMVADDFLAGNWGRFGQDVLSESLSRRDPYTSSPYCTEFNLKEGAGGLRDVGTLQKLADGLLHVPALKRFWKDRGGDSGILLAEERRALNKSLEFLMSVRNQLHFTLGRDFDVLEMRSQPRVAEALGYGATSAASGVEQLMRDLFSHTGQVVGILKSVQERFQHIRSVAWERPRVLPRRDLGDGFVEVQGKIYNACHPPFEKGETASRLINVFLLSQRRHLPISRPLLGQITANLKLIDDSFRASKRAAKLLLDLLAGSVGVADRLAWMRDCGLLQTYVPELAPLVNLVDYEESYDYTLDEHMVEAVRVIDELGRTRDEDELAQRELLSQVERTDLLRLALLLHHVGRASADGDAETIERIGKRMGMPHSDIETVRLLVGECSMLTELAERRDFEDAEVLKEAAARIASPEGLRMLYLLTYADARAAGRLGWFSWRDALLYEVYQKLMSVLVPGEEARATPEFFRTRLLELARSASLLDEAEKLAANAPERYKIEVSPEDALDHLKLMARLQEAPASMSHVIEGHHARIWFCTSDVPARFSQIAGVLTACGLNILSAHAFTMADGTILDRFIAHRQRQPISADPAFWQHIEETLVASISGKLNVGQAIAERAAAAGAQPPSPARRGVTSIHFDNDSSSRFTIVELVTWDRMGLLYSVGQALGALGANIEFAKISTRFDLAEDVFYVNDSGTGKKIESEERLAELHSALLAAVGLRGESVHVPETG